MAVQHPDCAITITESDTQLEGRMHLYSAMSRRIGRGNQGLFNFKK